MQMSCAPQSLKIFSASLISSEFFRVDGNEDIAVANLPLVTLGFQFRNAQADKPSGNAADRCPHGCA